MNCLVTGGNGFVGRIVAKMLAEKGNKVIAYDVQQEKKEDNNALVTSFDYVSGDITDLDHVLDTCDKHHIDTIVHTAAILDSASPPRTTKVNCDGTINILEAGNKFGMRRVVLTSSVAVFGLPDRYGDEPVPNDGPLYPATIYAASKAFCEASAQYYRKALSLDVIVVRFPHVYGLGRTAGMGTAIDDELFVKPALGQPARVPFGKATHNWLYVEDAARVLVLAALVDKTNGCVFTAGGYALSVPDVTAQMKKLIPGAEFTLLPGKSPLAYNFDSEPAAEELKFRPEWTLERAAKYMVEQVQKSKKWSANK
jgi:nucleoside-diphosphate-sugar epimerase